MLIFWSSGAKKRRRRAREKVEASWNSHRPTFDSNGAAVFVGDFFKDRSTYVTLCAARYDLQRRHGVDITPYQFNTLVRVHALFACGKTAQFCCLPVSKLPGTASTVLSLLAITRDIEGVAASTDRGDMSMMSASQYRVIGDFVHSIRYIALDKHSSTPLYRDNLHITEHGAVASHTCRERGPSWRNLPTGSLANSKHILVHNSANHPKPFLYL